MPTNRSDNSWDDDDVMPPVADTPALPVKSPSAPLDTGGIPRTPAFRPRPAGTGPSLVDINKILIDATIKLRRGLTTEARAEVMSAVEAGVRSAEAYELLGDIDSAEGDTAGAVAYYRKALEIEPGRPGPEAKIARAALKLTEDARRSTIGAAYAGESPAGIARVTGTSRKTIATAVIASLVFPGVGQMIKGEYVKGAVIAGVTLVAGMTMVGPAFNAVWQQLSQDFAAATSASSAVPSAPVLPASLWIGLIILTAAFLYSVIDAGVAPPIK